MKISEIKKALVTWISSLDGFDTVHVGLVIPQDVNPGEGYCYFEQSAEMNDPALDCDELDGVRFNVELFSTEITLVNDLADELKKSAREWKAYSDPLKVVQHMRIVDSGGQYVTIPTAGDIRVFDEGIILELKW